MKKRIPDQMYPRGKDDILYIDCRYRGVRIRQTSGTSDKRIAERILAELKNQVDNGEYQIWRTSFDECVKNYKENQLADKTEASKKRYEIIIRVHLLPAFKGKTIGDIVYFDPRTGKSEISEFFKLRSDTPESSLKKYARVLRDIIGTTYKGFELPPIVYKNKGFFQTKFLREDELSAIVSNLDERYQAIALLMAYTGLDLTEALEITWNEIDLFKKMVNCPRNKTSVSRRVPICNKLMEVLKFKSRVRNINSNRLFNFTDRAFQKAWKRAREKTTKDLREKFPKEKIDLSWVRVKDLRHFFGSFLLNKGVDSMKVAKLMGHTSTAMIHKRYGHYSDEALNDATSVFDEEEVVNVHKLSTSQNSG